jgi:hypothetical protein
VGTVAAMSNRRKFSETTVFADSAQHDNGKKMESGISKLPNSAHALAKESYC